MARLPLEEADRPSDQPKSYDVVMIHCICGIALLYFSKLHTKFFRFSWPNIYLALLNAALPSNDDLGARLFLHVLQCVPSRT